MNILVFTNKDSKAALSIKFKASWDTDVGTEITKEKAGPFINNVIGNHVKAIFAEVGQIVGAPTFTSQFTVSLE